MTKNRLRQIQPQQELGKAGPTCPSLLCWVAGTEPAIGFYFSLIFLNLLMVPTDMNSSENFRPGYYNHLCWRRWMHWDDSGASSRVSPARVEEDDEHRHDDEEAQGPQQVVQEDVHLCRAAVIRSLPEKAKYQVKWGFQFRWIMLLGWIVIHRDPRSPVIKFCCGVQPEIKNKVVSSLR